MPQDFILKSGIWIGEGKITFSASPEFIKFYTKWQITETSPGIFVAIQAVEMQGIEEHVMNYFKFSNLTANTFLVNLENEMMGSVNGKGLISEKTIAWEFRGNLSFEGFEIYERQENGDYSLHAEYASPDQFRTIIDGLIWEKAP